MWRYYFLAFSFLFFTGCGYKLVGWRSDLYTTVDIRTVPLKGELVKLSYRMRDLLVERTLAGSGLTPLSGDTDLVLESRLLDYRENVIATDRDGRTKTSQFTIRASFKLLDRQGKVIWSLDNYQYSDRYDISTNAAEFRDELVEVQDQALKSIADLVVTNITLAIAEMEAQHEQRAKSDSGEN